jgi:hypothetical protein
MKKEAIEIKEKDTQQVPQYNKNGSNIVGALLLIFVGSLFLANNLGITSWSVWNDFWKFWPVVLILLGLQFLLGKSVIAKVLMAVITVSVLTLGSLYILADAGLLKGTGLEKWNIGRISEKRAEKIENESFDKDGDTIRERIIHDLKSNGLDCNNKVSDGNILKDVCTVDKIVGNFAKGKMPQAYWIAVKQEDKWKAVITGNGIPSCKEIDTYSIPRDIYGNCIENSGELRF